MRRILETTVFVVLGACTSSGAQDLDEAKAKASFVFFGRATGPGVTFQQVPPSGKTLKVLVTQVLGEPPPGVVFSANETVTLEVKDPFAFPSFPTEETVFYAEGWILGTGVALRERHHEKRSKLPQGGPEAVVLADLELARLRVEEKRVDRVTRAAKVVVAGILIQQQVKAPASGRPAREHDGEWREGEVKIVKPLFVAPGVSIGGSVKFRYHESITIQPGTFVFILSMDDSGALVLDTPRNVLPDGRWRGFVFGITSTM